MFIFIITFYAVFFNEFEYHSGNVYSEQHYVIKFVSDLREVGGPGTPVSFTNKAARHDIAEMLLKVALSTKTPSLIYYIVVFSSLSFLDLGFLITRLVS